MTKNHFKFVQWKDKLEEVRYFEKGHHEGCFVASQSKPGKSILFKAKKDDFDCDFSEEEDKPIIIHVKVNNEPKVLSKSQTRKDKRRERNKAQAQRSLPIQ
uniref:Tub domain-containing protein n=1 Tax=Rhabditophanes sp. KR3021 TaxID=114890 RepID=A0AC35UBL8_9BILA